MRNTLLISAALTLIAAPAFAQSSYNVVVEPVTPSVEAIINAPIEYDENGVVKAQHFKADDLTDAQYKALLEEADRIRAFQSATQTGSYAVSQDQIEIMPSEPVVTYQTEAPTSAPVQIDLFESAPTTSASPKRHTVVKGDTLYNISKRYNTTVTDLQQSNGLSGTALSLGQTLTIPGVIVESVNTTVAQPIYVSAPMREGNVTRRVVEPVFTETAPAISTGTMTYAILPKDTLYSISRRTCVGVKALIETNGITNPDALTPGQTITLPKGHCLAK